jgi:chromosome segregation ATPase
MQFSNFRKKDQLANDPNINNVLKQKNYELLEQDKKLKQLLHKLKSEVKAAKLSSMQENSNSDQQIQTLLKDKQHYQKLVNEKQTKINDYLKQVQELQNKTISLETQNSSLQNKIEITQKEINCLKTVVEDSSQNFIFAIKISSEQPDQKFFGLNKQKDELKQKLSQSISKNEYEQLQSKFQIVKRNLRKRLRRGPIPL